MPLRVFISYSTKEDVEAQATLDVVSASLLKAGYGVFVDKKDIPLGYPWRQRILCEVMGCHVGVILFSRGALKSEWVFHEAHMMSTRKELAPDYFTLLSVLLEDVKVEDLKKERFAPLALDRFQIPQERTAPELAQVLVDRLGKIPRYDTHLERLGKRIALELSVLSLARIDQACADLGLDTRPWSEHEKHLALSNALAHRVMSEGMKGVLTIIRVLAPHLRSEKTQALLELLAPLWVHTDAAANIPRIDARRPPSWCVGLNGKHVAQFTAGMFLGRAYWPERRELIKVSAGGSDDLVGHIRQEMLADIRGSRNFGTDEEAEDYLHQTSETIFVSLPRKSWDKNALRDLRATYPNVTFLLDTGENRLANNLPTLPSEFEPLPELNLTEEQQAWVRYSDAKGVIKNYP